MITSRLVFPSDFENCDVLELIGDDEDGKEQLPRHGTILIHSPGTGTLKRDGTEGQYLYSGTFANVERMRGAGQRRRFREQDVDRDIQSGDVLIIGSDQRDYLYMLDETTLPAIKPESTSQMLNALFAILRDITSTAAESGGLSEAEIITAFATHFLKALSADHYFFEYRNDVFSTVTDGRLHGADLAAARVARIGGPILLDAANELEAVYGKPLGYAQLLAAPLHAGKMSVGIIMFSRTRFRNTVNDGHHSGFGSESLTFLALAVRFLEDMLLHNRILAELRSAQNLAGGAIHNVSDFAQRQSPPGMMKFLRDRIDPLATEAGFHLMLLGESGSGKGYTARYYHSISAEPDAPFVECNLAAIAPDLRLAELTGWKKGSFSGAIRDRRGLFTLAENGTLFIDEFADLQYNEQVALLSILGTGRYRVLGADEDSILSARVVVATNQNLPALIRSGKFRGDLLNRFIAVRLPPLNNRSTDVLMHTRSFLEKHHRRMDEDALSYMQDMDYSDGNMWLLNKVLEHLRIYVKREQWTREDVSAAWRDVTMVYGGTAAPGQPFFSIDEIRPYRVVMAEYIQAACRKLQQSGVELQREWCNILHISAKTLRDYLADDS